ncbi:GMC family oxidoreductase N-terminal domain-containing protein [Stappia taiwanensis]|uniref:GMC family oxidoreductase N-terminal domain-containing protein n=1 Tax=Stappia taiwanensis TaxID=992267 RepID=A0A838XTX4_9HYPH|nr:GMC family oxidoreductase N-terminal domain-containing protein [Stappia taiwanensis]MBA4613902.1 GMC family oxidoreductase N-terminal domain-containing protein [Stappia taiwanensis]GGF07693.1 dehydrogenase [Stappia taiwanensis]
MRDLGDWDYVIVGAGSAGCVLANRLSADPDVRVLLLEAGGKDDYIWIHIPVGYLYCMGNPRTDWGFSTAPEPGLNGRSLAYPRGRVLGGCSAINGMIYMRGQARDYDGWRQMGLTGWGWDDLVPLFRRAEDHYELDDEMHGRGGECRVEQQRLSWEILDAVREACAETGIPKVDDFNRGDNFGSSYFQVTQRGGVRWTAAKGYLKPVRSRANLKVVTGAQVTRLRLDGGRVTGLDLTVGGEPARAGVLGEAILSAGAIGSPQILELSGIGDPAVLSRYGIEVAQALPAVGGNLQDHLQLRTVFKVEGAVTLNQLAGNIFGKAKIAAEYALKRSGPMSMAPSQLGVFARSDPSFETANLEYHVQPLSLDRFGEPLHPFPAITASVCNLRPDSRGHVHIVSADPGAHPEIRPNYLSTDSDRKVAADALRLTRKIMAAPALARYSPSEYLPGPLLQSDEDLAHAAGDIGTTIFHPVGTCRMGVDAGAVVDERLRLRGIAGLRVVDASVMPTITSGNTAAPTMVIGEKAADLIREDRRAGTGR